MALEMEIFCVGWPTKYLTKVQIYLDQGTELITTGVVGRENYTRIVKLQKCEWEHYHIDMQAIYQGSIFASLYEDDRPSFLQTQTRPYVCNNVNNDSTVR